MERNVLVTRASATDVKPQRVWILRRRAKAADASDRTSGESQVDDLVW